MPHITVCAEEYPQHPYCIQGTLFEEKRIPYTRCFEESLETMDGKQHVARQGFPSHQDCLTNGPEQCATCRIFYARLSQMEEA